VEKDRLSVLVEFRGVAEKLNQVSYFLVVGCGDGSFDDSKMEELEELKQRSSDFLVFVKDFFEKSLKSDEKRRVNLAVD